MAAKQRLWKVLNVDLTPCHGGTGAWVVGEWMPPIIGPLRPCVSGYHLCRDDDLLMWLGPAIFPAEARGEVIELNSKVVAREARLLGPAVTAWNERTARLFACECAEYVLQYVDTEFRADCAEVIAVARRFANGEASKTDLAEAATYAANTARIAARIARTARTAATYVARTARAAAEVAAFAADAVAHATDTAAVDAAGAAAGAASAAARAAGADTADASYAARRRQTKRLIELLTGDG